DRVHGHTTLLAPARAIARSIQADDETVAHQAHRNGLVLDREIANADHVLGAETKRGNEEHVAEESYGHPDAPCSPDTTQYRLFLAAALRTFARNSAGIDTHSHGQNTLRMRPTTPPRVLPMSPDS